MKTYSAKPADIKKDWIIVDAEGQTLGRLASMVAFRLRGKHKPTFTPHVDTGDFVVIINADKIKLTGDKPQQKMYHHYSGFIGGLKSITAAKLLVKKPEDLIRIAVRGMLPKNRLGRQQIKKLKIYTGPEHPHEAQQPTPVTLEGISLG